MISDESVMRPPRPHPQRPPALLSPDLGYIYIYIYIYTYIYVIQKTGLKVVGGKFEVMQAGGEPGEKVVKCLMKRDSGRVG